MGSSSSNSTAPPGLRRILAHFRPYLRHQRLLIAGSTAGLMLEILLRLLEPWPLKFVFDRVIPTTPAGGASGIPALDRLSPIALLSVCAGAVVAVAGLRALTTYVSRVGLALVGNRVLTESRSELFSHLQRLSLSFHSRRRTGDLITRVTADIGRLKEVAVTAVMPFLVHALTLVGMLAVMLWMNWRLALVAMAVLPLFLLSTRRIGGRIRTVARKQRQREGEIGATAAEAISSIQTVQSLSLESVQERTFTAQNRSSLREGVKAKRLALRLVGTVDILIAIATAIVLFLGARLVIDGALTPGDLIVFLAYLKSAFKPMRDLAKYASRISKASASAERIIEVLDTAPLITDRPGAGPVPAPLTRVDFEDVTFGYDDDQVALDHFSLTARPGEVFALAGPSGAGKSTALNLLLRLYDPRHGRIMFEGMDIRDCTVESVRRSIALVPQENVLFAVSVRENIAYGTQDVTDEQIIAAARLARAHEFIIELPEGYDTILGERGATLSEGQRHRIAIARAAVRSAPILVLDEPAVSLDNENNRLVREALRALSRDRVTFVIAHDLSTVEEATTILFLDGGRILERGTHAELVKSGGRYAAMHAMRF